MPKLSDEIYIAIYSQDHVEIRDGQNGNFIAEFTSVDQAQSFCDCIGYRAV